MSTILMKPCLGFLGRVLVIIPTTKGKKVKIIPVMIWHLKQMYSRGGLEHIKRSPIISDIRGGCHPLAEAHKNLSALDNALGKTEFSRNMLHWGNTGKLDCLQWSDWNDCQEKMHAGFIITINLIGSHCTLYLNQKHIYNFPHLHYY